MAYDVRFLGLPKQLKEWADRDVENLDIGSYSRACSPTRFSSISCLAGPEQITQQQEYIVY